MGSLHGEAISLMHMGWIYTMVGHYKPVQPLVDRALEVYQQSGMLWELSLGFRILGDYLTAQGVYEKARGAFAEALKIRRELQNETTFIVSVLNQLAWIAYCRGDYETMAHTYQTALNELIENHNTENHDTENQDADSQAYPHDYYESLAGLAWGHSLRSSEKSAINIDPCLGYLSSSPPLMDSTSPLRLHLICHKVLTAMGDSRADRVLSDAQQRLQTHVEYIENPEWQSSFLEHVPENREIMRLVGGDMTGTQIQI